MGATNKDTFSVCFVAKIFGVISQNISTKKAVMKVAIKVPQLNPNIGIHKAVIIADIAILTKLFPIKIAAITYPSFPVSLWILWAFLIPLATIWRSLILLRAIIDVSEAAKRNEITARIKNNTETTIILPILNLN